MTKEAKSQTTELAVVDQKRAAELRAATGANESSALRWPPKIKINRVPYDQEENKMPTGKYMIKVNDTLHFLDDIDMIVMAKGTQFLRFSNKQLVGKTMIENSYNADYKDSLGGTRLGRVAGVKQEEMTKAQKEAQFYFYMFGVADVSQATNAAGERVYTENAAVWTPVMLTFKGRKSVDKQNEFKKLKGKNEAYFDFITRLEKPFKDGILETDKLPYYDFNMVKGDAVPLTNEILDSVEAIKSLIEAENKSIYKSYLEAQTKGAEVVEDSYTDLDLEDGTDE